MSTFNARLALDRKKLWLWITIQGIERVFKANASMDCSGVLGETRPESAVLVDPDEGAEDLDFSKLVVVGGGFSCRLVQPYGTSILDEVIRPRQRKATWLTADLVPAATSIFVQSTTGMVAGGYIYIGQETIEIGTVASATQLTGCTRGKFGSRAGSYKASSSALGAAVYLAPPALVGRRVTLYGSLLKDDGTTNASLTKTLATYVIEQSPEWIDERTLELRCGPLMDLYANAPLYQSVREVAAGAIKTSATDSDLVAVEVEDSKAFTLSTSGFPTYALLTRDGLGTIGRIYYVDEVSTPEEIGVYPEDLMDPAGLSIESVRVAGAGDEGARGVTTYTAAEHARHIAIVSGMTGTWALWLLLSRYGDGVNGTYDVLPGRERTAVEDEEFRFGAGIDEDDVDDAAFTEADGYWVTYPLMRQCIARDVVFEVCIQTGRFCYVKADGTWSLARLGDSRDTPVLTLDDSYCLDDERPSVKVDEEGIAPRLVWRADYDPNTDEFILEHVSIDMELVQRYPQREEKYEVESRGIGVDISEHSGGRQQLRRAYPLTLSELDQIARSYQSRGGRGRLLLRRKFKLAASVARVGDVVTVGFSARDGAGGDVLGSSARVIGRRPSHAEGWCELTLEVFEPIYRFAPSSVIVARSTVSIANDTYELSTTAPDAAGSSPQNDFAVGDTVRIWDMSAGTSTTAVIAELLSGPPRLRFTAAVAAPEANRDWLTWNTLGTSSGTTVNGDDESDWAYFMPDTGVAAEGSTRRWG